MKILGANSSKKKPFIIGDVRYRKILDTNKNKD
jgi:hypothetical protein